MLSDQPDFPLTRSNGKPKPFRTSRLAGRPDRTSTGVERTGFDSVLCSDSTRPESDVSREARVPGQQRESVSPSLHRSYSYPAGASLLAGGAHRKRVREG